MILAIDTSTQWMGLALFDGSQVLYEKVWRTNRRHTVELVPSIENIFKETGLEITTLKAIAVALGPGSFTSMRIGLSVAKGLSLSLKIPVIGVRSLDISAYGQPVQGLPLFCVLKVGRGRFAAQEYRSNGKVWETAGDLLNLTPHELEERVTSPTLICGEIDMEDRTTLERRWRNALVATPAANTRRPAHLAEIAWARLAADDVDDSVSLAPIYVHSLGSPTL
jgi:tRNA threonylcarbamoyladenosine biosynthesis protein TsaB